MKKMLNLAAIAVVAVMAAVSCSDKETGADGPDIPADGMGYFSFNLSTGTLASGSRTGTTDVGTNEENIVHNVTILLYDATGDNALLRYRFDLDAQGGAGSDFSGQDVVDDSHATPPTKASFVSAGRQVLYQDYQMVVLANANGLGQEIIAGKDNDYTAQTRATSAKEPAELPNFMEEGTSTLDELMQVFKAEKHKHYNDAPNGFFMSNANGVVPVAKTQLKGTKVAAEADPVKVKIDRLLAKAGISTRFPATYTYQNDGQSTIIITDGGTRISDLGYRIDKENKVTYLLRHWALFGSTDTGNTEAEAGTMETYSASYSANRKFIYATDPNFTSQDPDDFTSIRVTDSGELQADPFYPIPKDDAREYEYVFENTMSLDDQKADNYLNYTTHFVVRAYITPKDFIKGESYYSFVNTAGEPKVFTHEQAVEWKKEDSYSTDMDGLKTLINGLAAGEFDQFAENTVAYGEFRTHNGITYHPSGLNLYRIPIKHFVPDASSSITDARQELYGHYGVVRNNIYSVVITKFDGPGTGSYAWISADISVNEWYIRADQEEEL